jgi:hypothetical protein
VVYVDFRVARDEVRWRAKSVGLPGLELVAHSPSEISLLVNQMVGDRV